MTTDGKSGFSVLGISHVGLAPRSVDESTRFFSVLLGLEDLGSEVVKEQQTVTTMIASAHSGNRESALGPRLELLAPTTPEEGPIGQFLAKKGSGIHHLALRVSDIHGAIAHLQKSGVVMIDAIPRLGAHHSLIAFVHPRSTGGLLIELVQENTNHEKTK